MVIQTWSVYDTYRSVYRVTNLPPIDISLPALSPPRVNTLEDDPFIGVDHFGNFVIH